MFKSRWKVRVAWAAVGVVLLCTVVLVLRRPQPPRTLRVGADNYAPYSIWRNEAMPAGFAVDVLQEAARRQNIRLQWVHRSGGDGLLQRGEFDLWLNMARTPDRVARIHITEPWLRNDFCIVSKAGTKFLTPADCEGKKVGFVNGPFTRLLAQKFLPKADRKPLLNRQESLLALCRGEVDATFAESRVLQELLLRRPPACAEFPFQSRVVPGASIELGTASSFALAGTADRLRKEIQNLRADGTFSRLLAEWLPTGSSDTVVLFHEQERRHRTEFFIAGMAGAALLCGLLLLNGIRLSRSRNLAEAANTALETSLAELRGANQRLRFYFDRMPLAYIAWDREFRVREWNPTAELIFGWTAAEALGETGYDLIVPPEVRELVAKLWVQVLAGDEASFSQNENVDRAGNIHVCEWFNQPLRDQEGKVTGCLSMIYDATARTRAAEAHARVEEQLAQASKLESIGRLAGGVAHDFNNLLTVINGYGELLLRRMQPGDQLLGPVQQICKAGERAAELTRQMLAFSRKQVMQPKVLCLNEVVQEEASLLRRVIGEDVELILSLDPDLALVKADPGQIHQVIMNLAVNARDAMPAGGTLCFETSSPEGPGVCTECGSRPHVVLRVRDTGKGMDEAARERVFEPFFTTKDVGKGTGLGLATVYGIVQQSGGHIWVESRPGSGTEFTIHLPAAAPVSSVDVPVAPPAGGREVVLLVEDQEDVRKFIACILTELGYRVIEASDGQHAMETCAARASTIDVLVSDVVMPRMRGPELASRLRALNPDLHVIFISGYTDLGFPSDAEYLQKPFAPDDLARKIREVLTPA